MASTKEYLDFVLEQLSGLDEISCRAMMGEYILYYRGRVFGGIYDDRLLVKPVPTAVKLMPDASMELPYEGAKEMILVFVCSYELFAFRVRVIFFHDLKIREQLAPCDII